MHILDSSKVNGKMEFMFEMKETINNDINSVNNEFIIYNGAKEMEEIPYQNDTSTTSISN